MSIPFSQFLTPTSPLVSICFFSLCLYFCFANKIIYTIFLDSKYICVNIQYLFFSF